MQGDDGKPDKLATLIRDHVPQSQQGEGSSSETIFRLPRDEASK